MGTQARSKPKHLAAKLLAIRQASGLSQSELIRKLDCDLSNARISEYESGAREPNLLILLRYSEIAGVHMVNLVDDRVDLTQFRDALQTEIKLSRF